MTTSKVFVGNLAFQTTDQALAEAFTDCGNVKSGVIITRGRRSLGYGFVEFATPEEAQTAVDKKHQSDLLYRKIKVELVRDPTTRPPRPPRPDSSQSPQTQNTGGGTSSAGNPTGGNSGGNPTAGNRAVNRGGNRGGEPQAGNQGPSNNRPFRGGQRLYRRTRNPPARNTQNPAENTADENYNPNTASIGVNTNTNQTGTRRPKRRRRINNNNNNRINNNDNTVPTEDQPPKEKILSKTAVFVANLPFSVTDEQLKQIFSTFNVKSARVVTTRTGRSRGYGFVDFVTETDQKKAIDDKNNSTVEGNKGNRVISVSVSHSVSPTVEEEKEDEI